MRQPSRDAKAMDGDQILREISDVIRDVLDLPNLVINMATKAENVEGWDSFNHINIVVTVEAHFAIKFQAAEFEDLKGVACLVDSVQKKLSTRGRG